MEITGYKYLIEQDALDAQTALRVFYLGDPIPPDRETREWVNVYFGTYEGESFWYIVGDFTEVLGTPTTFNIDTNG
jgi:hypothetical protein